MAAARCLGFALPLQTGAAGWRRQPYEKLQVFPRIELNPQRAGAGGFLQLGLGQGKCGCRAGAKHDAGYKRSVNSKRADSKKSEKYASVAEASGTGRQAKKVSRVKKNQATFAITDDDIDDSPPVSLLNPLAGFVLDDLGEVILVAPPQNRIVTIVDPATRKPLECMIRRVFSSSSGEECLLLLPLDIPLQILKIEEEREGLIELSDAELEEVLLSMRSPRVVSILLLVARGGFCYTEKDIIDLNTEYGEGLGGSLAEGVEVASFQMDNNQYIMYTPFDPLMFIVHKDATTGELTIADGDLLDDEAVLDAIDEENEFRALVEEEEAVYEALKTVK